MNRNFSASKTLKKGKDNLQGKKKNAKCVSNKGLKSRGHTVQ